MPPPTDPTRPLPPAGRRTPAVRRPARAGMSLVEVLVSLAITAALLTAVASAFSASTTIISTNDEYYRATQAARVAMNLIMSDCRRGTPDDADWSQTHCRVLVWNNGKPVDRTYSYDAANKQLRVLDNDTTTNPTATQFVVARNVAAARFFVGNDGNTPKAVNRVTL
ncbi:MAG TPA: type II secretion system protein, partial [Tepidisphaeraceae bacterium]|nr:type II secretion system protein [Tepidisphaeraceae bacterium]